MHKLVEISRCDWPKLRDLYIKEKRSPNAYNTLECLIRWKDRGENEIDIKIYALDGIWHQDGTFVAVKQKPCSYVFCNTLHEDISRLQTALKELKKKLSSVSRLYFGFPERLRKIILENCGFPEPKPNGTYWYYIEQEKAKQFKVDIPDGYTMRRLEPHHTEQVNSIWPHRSDGSEIFVRRLITYNDNVGVFDETGKLVAWSLLLPIGSLGLVQVLNTHKRLGFGNLVVRYMAKLLAEKGIEVTAPVVFDNVASRTMFERLGFYVIDKAYWLPIREQN